MTDPEMPAPRHSEQMAFRALADPTRRQILQLLAQDNMTIAEVAENFQMTRAAVKKHLTILDQGNLISVRVEGRARLNSLNPDGLKQVFDWFGFFDAFWDSRLALLKSEIEKDIQ
ncbi:ArsR/SmtB family transcription factor [Phaeobacter porticola]|uniref:Transcriptional regulator, ArsR family n=1 Tax=Phaeobacter porticola TaxID=1844006 RepID=A0A1L3IB29_9RHOB|nr:metalloregulator ArsR/SmtB family transcription factor [Phaeobacter porticola]APG49399.1 transcriptional regulator, ArsR family [Phaeobacter porticola]